MTDFVKALRDDVDPTGAALAMADAIHQHIEDLLDDDSGDDDARVLPLLDEAERYSDALRRALRDITVGGR